MIFRFLPLVALLAVGCGATERLNGGGASFVYPIILKWGRAYERDHGVQVDYQSTGSGNGVQQMIARTIDFGCTDAVLTKAQIEKAAGIGGEVLHIPLVMGGIVVVYHLAGIDQPLRFTGPLLADIYLGKITRWDDPAIREINPGVPLPDLGIVAISRSDGSGTTHIVTEYLSAVSPEWRMRVGTGTAVQWPIGVGARGNEGIAGQVRRSPGALGYVEHIYADYNRLPHAAVRNRAGRFVRASPESITAAAVARIADVSDDLTVSLIDAPGEESYPICGINWAVFYRRQPAGRAERLRDFLHWVTHDGQRDARGLGYAPLPSALTERIDARLARIESSP